MSELSILSGSQQVAAHLREQLLRGRWTRHMPGRSRLAGELGVSKKLVDTALAQLEDEGLLHSEGPRRRRRIVLPDHPQAPSLRVAILDHDPLSRSDIHAVETLHRLIEEGHTAFSARLTLVEMSMDVRRVARLVEETKADAWIVVAGSRDVLTWFSEQPLPAFALFGRQRGLSLAGGGPDKPPAMAAATRRLVELGHRRIVLLARRSRRRPRPGAPERAFLDELVNNGITPSTYHLPDWDETVDGFHACLEGLIRVTPPTALFIDEPAFLIATLQFLAKAGLRVPEDISLISNDGDPHFSWCRPSIAHIRWDSRPVVRRVIRWAANVARGATDRRQNLTRAEFVEAESIGPVAADRGGGK